MEIAYIIGAATLLAVLVSRTTQYRKRGDPLRERSEQIVEKRYEREDN